LFDGVQAFTNGEREEVSPESQLIQILKEY